MKEFLNKYKKYILIVALVLVIIVLILVFGRENINKTINSNKDVSQNVKVLKVTYKNGKEIDIDNFGHSFNAEKEIIVENATNKYITYDMEWLDVENTLNNQSNFTYMIEGTGNNAGMIGKSQVPVSNSKILSSVMISPNKKHIYKVIFNYESKFLGENALFKGYINIHNVK